MRLMQLNHSVALAVPAAHSRVIQPGDCVDFDEVIHPAHGTPYSLETAIGPDADKFAPAPEPAVEPSGEEPCAGAAVDEGATRAALEDASLTDVEPAPAPEPAVELKAQGRGRKKS